LQHGETAAHIAAGHGQLAVLRLLQKHGANLQNLDEQGDTPLIYAAKGGHLDTVRFLLQAGIAVGVQDKVTYSNFVICFNIPVINVVHISQLKDLSQKAKRLCRNSLI
jgi:ankyrin repeat protein